MSSPGASATQPNDRSAPEETPSTPGSSPSTGVDSAPTLAYPGPSTGAALPHFERTFGDYELLKELGRGGMGVVYKARQKALDRIVALKMILPGPLANSDDLQRFRTEAEATARLRHPNIVTLHEIGEVAGQHFYSMDYIEGPTLAQRLLIGPMANRTAARHVMLSARAMQHAHSHGVLHRDLKPSNILLDGDDEPHITDFGLAKRLGANSGQTHTGMVMGTPSYMSPEQAAGKVRELGPACDIYSLGAVLYELLTGRPPFRSETPVDTLRHVLEVEPAPPRLLNPKIDHDLQTICLKCLEKNPAHRYASAGALADDLDRYLKGDAISARSFNMLDRLTRTLDRSQHDVEFGGWSTLLLLFAAIVFVGHLIIFALMETGQPQPLHWMARLGQFGLMGVLFWRFRARRILPTTGAERQLWSIWIGYLLAYAVSIPVSVELARDLNHPWDERMLYPYSAVLTGLALFIMGSNYWGWCYAIGLLFLGLAVPMALEPNWAPLEFGMAWSATLLALGLHVRRPHSGG